MMIACLASAQTPEEWFRRGALLHQRGDLQGAIREYQEALKLRPELLQARENLGAALAATGRVAEAIDAFRHVAERRPGNRTAQLNLAQALLKGGRTDEAAKELERIHITWSNDIPVIRLLAQVRLTAGDYKRLLELVEPVSRRYPENGEFAFLTGTALIRSGRPEEGLVVLDRAPRDPNALVLAGATALNLGQTVRARESLDRAVALDDRFPGALSWAGLAHDKTGDEKGAALLLSKALKLNPGDFEARLNLGAVLYRQKDYSAARPHVEEAVKLQPSSPMARYALALLRSANNETEAAVSDLEKIVAENPEWVEPRVKLASLYFRMQRESDGLRQRAAVDKLTSEGRGRHASFEQ